MHSQIRDYFKKKKITPFPYQQAAWDAFLEGHDALIHAPTGYGKSYAAWMGPLCYFLNSGRKSVGCQVVWVTPLRALAADTARALSEVTDNLGIPWSVEVRTGDTSSSQKARHRKKLPECLVITPESLSLLLSYPESKEHFQNLLAIVVDEWHVLLGTKRGVQTELALARLKTWSPNVRISGLSATIGNMKEALDVLVGSSDRREHAVEIVGDLEKKIDIQTLIPQHMEHFPWMGHLGLKLLPEVIRLIESARTTLLFTNVRSQSEIWYQALLQQRPEWTAVIGIHHGSIENERRVSVEQGLRDGTLKCVVATSSLDLGVDFSPVEQVIQVGGPKGIARLLQRAGRSGHQPGQASRIVCVPAHAFELLEFSAARDAVKSKKIESRPPLKLCLDVLIQHIVTVALGTGFTTDALLSEVQDTYAFRELTREQWDWTIDFVARGGTALQAYSNFLRICECEGLWKVHTPHVAKLHRMSIGTIVSDGMVRVQFLKGKSLGNVEESFAARLNPGDTFVFAGQRVEFVRMRDMVAYVVKAKKSKASISKWNGAKMPLSSELSDGVRERLANFPCNNNHDSEMKAITPILEVQHKFSHIPNLSETLIETHEGEDGFEIYIYPFEGRLVHEGIGALIAHRIVQSTPCSINVVVNDYGFQLLLSKVVAFNEDQFYGLFSTNNLLADILSCVNSTELARRHFREIARIAGLIFQGYPGQHKSTRHVQASSALFYNVFEKYDPENLLLAQARREVLENQLEFKRLRVALERLQTSAIRMIKLCQLSPLSFPMWAEFTQASVSGESWNSRLERMLKQLEGSS